MVAFLAGLAYIPLAATGSETVNKANVLAVRLGLALPAAYWLPDAMRSYSHRNLRWATICHSLVAICHAMAAMVILMFDLRMYRHSLYRTYDTILIVIPCVVPSGTLCI